MKDEDFTLATPTTHLLGEKNYVAHAYLCLNNLLHMFSHQDGGSLNT